MSTLPKVSSAEEFAVALGVKVTEVPTLNGNCAVFDHDTGTIEVCRKICPTQRREAFEQLLPLLEEVAG